MKKFVSLAAAVAVMSVALPSAVFAEDAAAPAVEVKARKMLYDASGNRLAIIYRVTAEGNPQVILNGRMLTVPASTLSEMNGKITTSLTKAEIVSGS